MRVAAPLCTVLAALLLSVPTLAGAESPGARASAQCGKVTTRNGGKAEFVNTVKATCLLGRRVAKRANGRRYTFLGFECKPERKRGIPGKLYGCGRFKNGTGQGVGFIYRAPRRSGPRRNCQGYTPCLTPGPDVDCAGGSGDGPRYVNGPVYVNGSDPYGLDSDGNGVGCES